MKKIVLFFAAIAVISCVSPPSGGGKDTSWADDLESVYPESEYLAVVGTGDNLNRAKEDGSKNLSLIFEARISVETEIVDRYNELSTNGIVAYSTELDLTESISQQTDQSFINMRFSDSYTDDMGQVNVVCYLDRMDTARIYKERIDEESELAKYLFDNGVNSNDPLAKYAYLDAAMIIDGNIRLLLQQLDIIKPGYKDTIRLMHDPNSVRRARGEAASDLIFSINISGTENSNINSVVADQITSAGFSVDPNGTLIVFGSFNYEPVTMNNDYKAYKWYLDIGINNSTGIEVVTLSEDGRSAQLTESAAYSRMLVDVERQINLQLIKQLQNYFLTFIEK